MNLPFRFGPGRFPVLLPRLYRVTLVLAAVAALALCRGSAADCVIAPTGLVAWWPGNGDTVDAQNGNNASVSAVTFDSGAIGSAFVFDGTSSIATVPGSSNMAVESLTIEAWLYPTDLSIARPIVEYANSSGPCSMNFWYSINPGPITAPGALYAFFRGPGTSSLQVFTPSGILPANTWTHVALTYDAPTGTAWLYTNGTPVATATASTTPFLFDSHVSVNLGYRPVGSSDLAAGRRHAGKLDEIAIYNRALSGSELKAIYLAGSAGKCPIQNPPVIAVQPTNQICVVGDDVVIAVGAGGWPPLAFQWKLNGAPIPEGTNSVLNLKQADATATGFYSVTVSNAYGSTPSAEAQINVIYLPCTPAPDGLVSWWPAEGTTLDVAAFNHGTFAGEVAFGPGRAGQAFVFDGLRDGIQINSPTGMLSPDFTIEAWVRRSSETIVTYGAFSSGYLFAYGNANGIGFYLDSGGKPTLTKIGVNNISAASSITDTNYHHVAVTKQGSTVVFYIDGQPEATSPYDPGFAPTGNAVIGAWGLNFESCFLGSIDELAFYSRGLSDTEIQSIHYARRAGKCPLPVAPYILSQPTNKTVISGDNCSLSVLAGGALPLSYLWFLNGQPVPGATDRSLVLTNVQAGQAGTYSAQVTNAFGLIPSSGASLTVVPRPPCVPEPCLISWWQGDATFTDTVGGNNPTVCNGVSFAPGMAHEAFQFSGSSQYLEVPNAPSLYPVNAFTVEGWVLMSAFSSPRYIISKDGDTTARQFLLNIVSSSGRSVFRAHVGVQAGYVSVTGTNVAPTNAWTHVAMSFDSTNLTLYVNGKLDGSTPAAGPAIGTTQPVRIGSGASGNYFAGRIDELALIGRALSFAEIQAIYAAGPGGKCAGLVPPFLLAQPTNQSITLSSNTTLYALAGGSVPLSYQWFFNGSPLEAATNSWLSLANLKFANAGTYYARVTNSAGLVLSSNSVVNLVYPPALMRVLGTNAESGATLVIPVTVAANGNENALGFSLGYDQTKLMFAGASVASGARGAVLMLNSSMTNSGKIGLALAFPPGGTLTPGTQEVAVLRFSTGILTNAGTSPLTFGDQPAARQLLDSEMNFLSAWYSNATILISAANFEGDSFPRPAGDRTLSLSDWLLLGRYVARMEYPTNAPEFQRADCAPRSSGGDGAVRVTDWVQAGRYAFGLDAWSLAGGPAAELAVADPAPSAERLLTIGGAELVQQQPCSVVVSLGALGNENAVGFSVAFDSSKASFTGAHLGGGASDAMLFVNQAQASSGRIGLALALPVGRSATPQTAELVRLDFIAAPGVSGSFCPTFADIPVMKEVSDPAANALPVTFVTSGPPLLNPVLNIESLAQGIRLTWPLWATNYDLQEGLSVEGKDLGWTYVEQIPSVIGSGWTVTLPATNGTRFYRLSK